MQYVFTIVDVKDADALVINHHDGSRWWTAVVDAGNVGDGSDIKPFIKHEEDGQYVIDYAFLRMRENTFIFIPIIVWITCLIA